MEGLTVVKVGGKVLENEESLDLFINQFTKIAGKKLLIHGGGVLADRLLEKQGLEPRMINGRRVTDEETLETVIMVYGGLVNKKVVANLIKNDTKAVGLTGADGLIAESVKRPSRPIDYGFAGDIIKINTDLLVTLLEAGYVPVIAPLSMTSSGQILNTNADTIATQLAINLASHYAVKLVYGFEIEGVMKDVNDPGSLIKALDKVTYLELLSTGNIHSGMVPKLDNAFMSVRYTLRTIITHFNNIEKAVNLKNKRYTEIIDNE